MATKFYKLILLSFFISTTIFSQKENSLGLGHATLDELKMTVYDKDSTAKAVVLYEYANYYIDKNEDYNFRTDFYYRIKIFDKKAFDEATIDIVTFEKERIIELRAKTYNLTEIGTKDVATLYESAIYTKDIDERFTKTTFTLPNIKEGAIIEYKYSLLSPYPNIDDWEFQRDIPKIKSEIDVSILGNYRYNVRIVGYQKLDREENSIKKYCVSVPNSDRAGDCELLFFGMNNIPAFVEEDYMTSKKNFASRLIFDLKTYTSLTGEKTDYTETWEDAENTLKKYFLDNQTSKKGYFKRNLPDELVTISDDLVKAKKVFQFIQNHYTWNENYWNGGADIRVKEAFDEKIGSVADINLSLFNALNAAGIATNVVMLSTRENGLPTTLFPVTNDFNYVIVKVTINKKEYFLDATNKYLAFGEVPLRCLNGDVRVLDFKKEGYWQALNTIKSSNITKRIVLAINKDGDFEGEMNVKRTGYEAIKKREEVSLRNPEQYLESIEGENSYLVIDGYKSTNLNEYEKPFIENFKIKLENENTTGDSRTLRINPFIIGKIKSNPFKLKERNYPVDFGYPTKSTFSINFIIPENYTITQLPKELAIKLPNNSAVYLLKVQQKNNKINIYAQFSINKAVFTNTEYYFLKEFYSKIIKANSGFIEIFRKD